MKKYIVFGLLAAGFIVTASDAQAAVKRIGGYTKSNGTYVESHYRDTSNDGNPYNNANYLGYND